MAINGINIGPTHSNKIESIEGGISKGVNKVANIGEETIEELELEMGLRQLNDKEVIAQYEADGYRVFNIDDKSWTFVNSNDRPKESLNVRLIYFEKPGEGIKIEYLKYNENGKYELLEGLEKESVIKTIEQTEEALGSQGKMFNIN